MEVGWREDHLFHFFRGRGCKESQFSLEMCVQLSYHLIVNKVILAPPQPTLSLAPPTEQSDSPLLSSTEALPLINKLMIFSSDCQNQIAYRFFFILCMITQNYQWYFTINVNVFYVLHIYCCLCIECFSFILYVSFAS